MSQVIKIIFNEVSVKLKKQQVKYQFCYQMNIQSFCFYELLCESKDLS